MEPYFVSVFLKDFRWEQTAKGWQPNWCHFGEGTVDKSFFTNLKKSAFAGPLCQHHEYDHGTGRDNDRVVVLGDPVKAPGGGGGPVAAIKYGRVKGTGAGDKTGRDQGQKQQGAEFRFHGSRIKWINHKRQAAYQRLQPCQKSGNSRATDLGIEGYPSINRCLPNAEDPGVFRNFSDYWTKSSFWDAG